MFGDTGRIGTDLVSLSMSFCGSGSSARLDLPLIFLNKIRVKKLSRTPISVELQAKGLEIVYLAPFERFKFAKEEGAHNVDRAKVAYSSTSVSCSKCGLSPHVIHNNIIFKHTADDSNLYNA